MNYKIFLLLFLLFSCTTPIQIKDKTIKQTKFNNKGFALLYTEDLKQNKLVSKSIDDRSLIIFQKNLEKDTDVKITNLLNNKYILVKVGENANYPFFYNSVISKRIYDTLEIDINEPYVEIITIKNDSGTFIAKKAKTFEEEKKVADKAPVENITIKNLGKNNNKIKKINKKSEFNYIIKVADFYFKESANLLIKKIKSESSTKKVKILNISKTKYRVYIGPFKNLKSLKKAFNDISIIDFENLEIIKI